MKSPNPELVAKRKRRAIESRKRMAARGINLHKWHTKTRQQQQQPPRSPA